MSEKTPHAVCRQEDGILIISLNRPRICNAVSISMLEGLVEMLDDAKVENGIRGVLIRSEGNHFSSGLDLSPLKSGSDPVEYLEVLTDRFNRGILAINRCRLPVVAALKGTVLGAGLGIALSCDLRAASTDVRLIPGYYARGLSMAGGMSLSLPRIAGLSRAKEMAFLGRQLNADEAVLWGIVARSVEPERLEGTAMSLAREISTGPTQALMRSKQMLNDNSLGELELSLDRERENLLQCAKTEDFSQNLQRFFKKESSIFKGR